MPKGVSIGTPPLNEGWPGSLWQVTQLPAAANLSPRLTIAGSKLDDAGGWIAAIVGCHAYAPKPQNPTAATANAVLNSL